MSYLSYNPRAIAFKHILVFDTIALLSANDKNPEQDWRNNESLGFCVVPGAAISQINNIVDSKNNNKNLKKAKKFLRFIAKGGSYKIYGIEDNKKIPITQDIDRQILACAHRLAAKNKDYVVILVTYDLKKMALVAQSTLPNFCMIEARDIAVWYHRGYFQKNLPQSIKTAYSKMGKSSGASQFNNFSLLPENSQSKRTLSRKSQQRVDLTNDGSVITIEQRGSGKPSRKQNGSTSSAILQNSSKEEDKKLTSSNHVSFFSATIALIVLLCIAVFYSVIIKDNSRFEIERKSSFILYQQVTELI